MTDAPTTPSGREARSPGPTLARDYCCTRCGVPTNAVPFGPFGEEWCFDCAYYAPDREMVERVASFLRRFLTLQEWEDEFDVRPGLILETMADLATASRILETDIREMHSCDCCGECHRGDPEARTARKAKLRMIEDAMWDLDRARMRGLPAEPKPVGALLALMTDAAAGAPTGREE